MSGVILRAGRPDATTLARLLDEASAADPTYDFLGATVDPAVASPFPVRRRHRDLGRGDDVMAAAVEGMRAWAQHRGILATVHPLGATHEVGRTVVVVLPAGPVSVVAPCRIVRVIDEDRRFGFAYGSLPGHPEQGEEGFVLDHLADGTVRFTITVSARPGPLGLRLVAPVVTLFQQVAIRRYLGAMQSHVSGVLRR